VSAQKTKNDVGGLKKLDFQKNKLTQHTAAQLLIIIMDIASGHTFMSKFFILRKKYHLKILIFAHCVLSQITKKILLLLCKQQKPCINCVVPILSVADLALGIVFL
jgi:hypothetical protein